MKDLLIGNIMTGISNNYDYDKIKLAEIKYGLEVIYMNVTKYVVILIINILLGLVKELLLFTLAFAIIKTTGYGLHAKKSWQCWIASIIIYILIPYLIKYISLPQIVIYILLPFTIISFILWAPADTEKRPLINKKKRNIFKIITVIISIVYSFLILTISNAYFIYILFYSLLLESLLINPIIYKIFGLKYNNYLSYKKKGGTQ